jgi:hypothetical protein
MRIRGFEFVGSLLLIAFALVPFTGLRFGPVGPGEVGLLVALLVYGFVAGGSVRVDGLAAPMLRFWMPFLVVSLLGFFFNYFVLDYRSGTIGEMLFDFAAYLFVIIVLILLNDERLLPRKDPELFFVRLYYMWFVIFALAYVVSLGQDTFIGLTLRVHNRFLPMVENVHHAAMVTSALPFLGIHLLSVRRGLIGRLIIAVSIPMYVAMALESGATKAMLAVVFGAIVLAYFFLAYRTRGRRRRHVNVAFFSTLIIAAIMVVWSYGDLVASLSVEFFRAEDPAQAREVIWADGLRHGLQSFVIGFGPGPQVPYGGRFWDAHNTILTLFLQGGVVAVALFAVFVAKIARVVSTSAGLVATLAAIGVYTAGGDLLRRIPIWIILVALVGLAKASRNRRANRASPTFIRQGPGWR